MFDSYLARMRQYGKFDGRTSRRDYWMYSLVFVGLMILGLFLDAILGTGTSAGGLFMGLIWVAHLAPNLAITAERLHDQDRTAWWLLLLLTGIGGIVILLMMLLPGTLNSNRFGDVPEQQHDTRALGHFQEHAASAAPQNSASTNITQEIERLGQLRDTGTLSEDEFKLMKQRLINRLG